jgi:hypothetical protein
MEYKYPPIYKYLAFTIILFLFLNHYRTITKDKYIPIAIIFTLIVIMLDYVIIDKHPVLTAEDNIDELLDDIIQSEETTKKSSRDNDVENDLENDLDSELTEDLEVYKQKLDAYKKELMSRYQQLNNMESQSYR